MPYCEGCDRFYNPNTLSSDGNCPEGHQVAEPAPVEKAPTAPWHFKVMLALVILYLGWRLVQLADRFLF